MKSESRGTPTSAVEFVDVTACGLSIRVDGRLLTLGFADFPWFKGRAMHEVSNVKRIGGEQLRWPDLDVDLTIDAIEHPGRYPLVSR